MRLEAPQNALAVLTAMITPAVLISARRALIFSQLDRQTSRARLLQRAMLAFYLALSVFVATSVAIAIVAAVARS